MHPPRAQISCFGYPHASEQDSWYDDYCLAHLNCMQICCIVFDGCSPAGGIPAPVYFGALIDSTCLKWSIKKCGGRGACRIYESNKYRYDHSKPNPRWSTLSSFSLCLNLFFLRIIFLSLITCLSGCSYFFLIAVIFVLRRVAAKQVAQPENAAKEIELQSPSHLPKDPLNATMEWEEGKGEEGPRPPSQPETAALAAEPEAKVAWGRDEGRTGQMRLDGQII